VVKALGVGNRMLAAGMFRHVVDGHLLENKKLFYRFASDETKKTKARAADKALAMTKSAATTAEVWGGGGGGGGGGVILESSSGGSRRRVGRGRKNEGGDPDDGGGRGGGPGEGGGGGGGGSRVDVEKARADSAISDGALHAAVEGAVRSIVESSGGAGGAGGADAVGCVGDSDASTALLWAFVAALLEGALYLTVLLYFPSGVHRVVSTIVHLVALRLLGGSAAVLASALARSQWDDVWRALLVDPLHLWSGGRLGGRGRRRDVGAGAGGGGGGEGGVGGERGNGTDQRDNGSCAAPSQQGDCSSGRNNFSLVRGGGEGREGGGEGEATRRMGKERRIERMGGGGAMVVRGSWAVAAGNAGKMGKVGADGAGVGSMKEQYWAPQVDPPKPFVPALPPVSAWSGTGVHVRMRHNLQVRPGFLGVCCLCVFARVFARVCVGGGGVERSDETGAIAVSDLYHVCNLFCSLAHF
jgi:hypothetical protein